MLAELRCSKEHAHAQCQGGDTILTVLYPKVLTDIMVDNIFIGTETVNIVTAVYHQPPSGSLGFKSCPAQADVIQPFVEQPFIETFVDTRVCSIVQVKDPTKEPESESELYEFLIQGGFQKGLILSPPRYRTRAIARAWIRPFCSMSLAVYRSNIYMRNNTTHTIKWEPKLNAP